LQHHRETAIVGRRRFRRHAVDDFSLEHHGDIAQPRREVEKMKQKRRADVVREIAHDAQIVAQRAEVEFERIALVQRQSIRRKARAQVACQIAIDLDRHDAARAFDEPPGQRALPGADLDDRVARLRIDRLHDTPRVVRVDEEILAEAAARGVFHDQGKEARRRAIRRGSQACSRSSSRSSPESNPTRFRARGSPSERSRSRVRRPSQTVVRRIAGTAAGIMRYIGITGFALATT